MPPATMAGSSLSSYQAIDMTPIASLEPPSTVTAPKSPLAGRQLSIAATHEIVLAPGEVVLTFDDGPKPGTTDAILETLERFGVKATFFMVGRAVDTHPDLARRVAAAGHAVGSHTYDHPNLAQVSSFEAVQQIHGGEEAVSRALVAGGFTPSRFFRFPYVSETHLLRTSLIAGDFVVVGIDVDSKDYYDDTPQTVLARTLERLDARGRGIILFHDVHARTARMLPEFLQAITERGYRVVALESLPVPRQGPPRIVADLKSED